MFQRLSNPAVLPLVKGAFRAANAVAGRLGNKLTIQALRQEAPVAATEVRVASG
jgi:hypothetical protein